MKPLRMKSSKSLGLWVPNSQFFGHYHNFENKRSQSSEVFKDAPISEAERGVEEMKALKQEGKHDVTREERTVNVMLPLRPFPVVVKHHG